MTSPKDPEAMPTAKADARTHWTIVDAIWWVHNLPGREEPPLHSKIPSLSGAKAYPGSPVSRAWIDAATVVLAALRAGRVAAFRTNKEGSVSLVAAGFWNDKRVSSDPDYDSTFLQASDAKALWPGQTPPRKTQEQVIAWCREWIESGKGNGMDKAWLAFKKEPEPMGLTREHSFRPAWNSVKTQQTK